MEFNPPLQYAKDNLTLVKLKINAIQMSLKLRKKWMSVSSLLSSQIYLDVKSGWADNG